MKRLVYSLFIVIILFLYAGECNNEAGFKVQITKHTFYDNLSSASGVSILDGNIMLVGDDIPWLVVLNNDLSVKEKIKLSGIDSIVNGRTPYIMKADFECMETFEESGIKYTLVISSGSKAITRDTATLIKHSEKLQINKVNLRPFFEQIKSLAEMGDEEINIEGLAVGGEKAYLFHRGNVSGNFLVEISKKELMNLFLNPLSGNFNLVIYHFDLPEYEGIPSGFSGATYSEDLHALLFTASMEDTESVTTDGEVSGSYIGIIDLDKIKEGKYIAVLLEKENKILAKKLEGICIIQSADNHVDVVSVCDNDDGTSDLFKLRLITSDDEATVL